MSIRRIFQPLDLGWHARPGRCPIPGSLSQKKIVQHSWGQSAEVGPRGTPYAKESGLPDSGLQRRQVAPFTGHSGEVGPGPLLDQVGSHVYSPIIRTGHSPPSQLSTLDLVVAGKGFLCLRCKEGGNLVDDLCVTCGCSCFNSPCSHHILWQHQICSYVVFLS
jgi:hypothetical protein